MKVVKALASQAAPRCSPLSSALGPTPKTARPAALRSPKAFQRRNFKPRRAIVEACHGLSARGQLHRDRSDARTRGPAAGLYKEPIAPRPSSIMPAAGPRDGQCGPCPQPAAMVDALSTHFKDLDPPRPMAALREDPPCPTGRRSTMKVSPARIFRPARRATARTPMAWRTFRAWPANSTTTSSTS